MAYGNRSPRSLAFPQKTLLCTSCTMRSFLLDLSPPRCSLLLLLLLAPATTGLKTGDLLSQGTSPAVRKRAARSWTDYQIWPSLSASASGADRFWSRPCWFSRAGEPGLQPDMRIQVLHRYRMAQLWHCRVLLQSMSRRLSLQPACEFFFPGLHSSWSCFWKEQSSRS